MSQGKYYRMTGVPGSVVRALKETTAGTGIPVKAGVTAILRSGEDVPQMLLLGAIYAYFRHLRAQEGADPDRAVDLLVDAVRSARALEIDPGDVPEDFSSHVHRDDRDRLRDAAELYGLQIGSAGRLMLLSAGADIPGAIAVGLSAGMAAVEAE